jgi:cytochrome b involved in lipid metabolism
VLATRAGKIVTVAFDQASHSKHAREELLPKYRIGLIDKQSEPEVWQLETQTQTSPLVLVAIVLAIIALVYYLSQH